MDGEFTENQRSDKRIAMRGENSLFELLFCLFIFIILGLFIVFLQKINKKLNIYFLDVIVRTLYDRDNIKNAWLFLILIIGLFWWGNTLAAVYLIFCSLIILWMAMQKFIAIDEGREPSKMPFDFVCVVTAIGLIFVIFAGSM